MKHQWFTFHFQMALVEPGEPRPARQLTEAAVWRLEAARQRFEESMARANVISTTETP